MDRSHRIRWRDRRDTIPARRRRRRSHRRDSKRGGTYYPMEVDPQAALRGVRARLVGAVMAASITLVCVLYAMLTSLSSFGATFALTMGICSFGAAVALLLSARHEEEVHELATEFNRPAPADAASEQDSSADQPRALPAPNPLDEFNQPLDGAERAEPTTIKGARRRDFSGHTDGAL